MKQYNGEKAIISLTSWKGRIDTVSKTILNLLNVCPGFHIVLVLSIDEFPKKEEELPEDLILMQEFFEIIWVQKNYKSFKKILFTMDKYKDVPIISADDDCYYTTNYAEQFYNEWVKHPTAVISYHNKIWNRINTTWGCSTLYPPNYFKQFGIENLTDEVLAIGLDDNYYMVLRYYLKLYETRYVPGKINYKSDSVIIFHNENQPLKDTYLNNNRLARAYDNYVQILRKRLN